MSDAETLRIYGREAGAYAERNRTRGRDDAGMAAFLAALPARARVLDLGCGPGFCAAHFARSGHAVDATDAVPEMVEMAAAHPGVTAWQASFDELDAEAAYDGIWANFALLHAARAEIPRHLAAIARALRPGGVLHLGMKEGAGEKRDALGRFYTYVTEAELRGWLEAEGLQIESVTRGGGTGLDGSRADWLMVLARA